jgi:hypothetical protein
MEAHNASEGIVVYDLRWKVQLLQKLFEFRARRCCKVIPDLARCQSLRMDGCRQEQGK